MLGEFDSSGQGGEERRGDSGEERGRNVRNRWRERNEKAAVAAAVGGGKYRASSEVWGNIAASGDGTAYIAMKKF